MRSRLAKIRSWLTSRPKSNEGATTVEYSLMVGLIALVAVGAVIVLGEAVQTLFESVMDSWP